MKNKIKTLTPRKSVKAAKIVTLGDVRDEKMLADAVQASTDAGIAAIAEMPTPEPVAAPVVAATVVINGITVPIGATHFRLTRACLDFAADVRHMAEDLEALGQRDGDKLEFGVLNASGNFSTNARSVARDPNAPKSLRGTGKMLLIDSMIVEGTHTAKQIAQASVDKFGGDLVKTLVVVRSRPWHMKKAGKLTTAPFVHEVRVKKEKVVLTVLEKAKIKQDKKIAAATAFLAKMQAEAAANAAAAPAA